MVKRNMRRRGDGFSLIEMAVVLSITGLMVGIVIPSVVSSFGQRATRTAVDQLTQAHSLARATAVRFGRVAELHIDDANARFWVQVDTTYADVGDSLIVGSVNDLAEEQVTMSSNREVLCFDSRGLATTRDTCESGDVLVQFSVAGRTESFQTTVLGKVLR